jgi:DnaJ-domain-containing protein 1
MHRAGEPNVSTRLQRCLAEIPPHLRTKCVLPYHQESGEGAMEAILLLGILAAIAWLLIRRARPRKSLGQDGTGWWYLKAGKAVGPVTLDTLRQILIHDPDAAVIQVWRSGFADWVLARDVPSLVGAAERPPPIVTTPTGPRIDWSRVLKLWTALAACYVLAAVLVMGERGGKLRPLVNHGAVYEVSFPGGTVTTFDTSKSYDELRRDISAAITEAGAALLKSGKRAEAETIGDVGERSEKLIENLTALNRSGLNQAYVALGTIVILPPTIVFVFGIVIGRIRRLGDILYSAACVLAVLCLALGWLVYNGVDNTGIEVARQHGHSDAQIVEQRKNQDKHFKYDEALKDGISPTEILDHIVEHERSYNTTALIAAAVAALLCWALGLGIRFVLRRNAGAHQQQESESEQRAERKGQHEQSEAEKQHREARRRQAEQHRTEQQRRTDKERDTERRRQQQSEDAAAKTCEDQQWWEVLEVSPDATTRDIRGSYLRKMRQYHPDRVAGLAPEFVEMAERRTKALNAAYAEAVRARAA